MGERCPLCSIHRGKRLVRCGGVGRWVRLSFWGYGEQTVGSLAGSVTGKKGRGICRRTTGTVRH